MRRMSQFFPMLALLGATNLAAQAPLLPKDGDRVRVTAPGHALRGYVGTVRTSQDGTLAIDSLTIPMAAVTQLEVSAGSKSHWLAGMGIGFMVGATVGAIIGANQEDCNACALPGAIAFGAGGAVVGLITGLAIRTERWQGVDVDQLRAETRAGARFQLGLSFSF